MLPLLSCNSGMTAWVKHKFKCVQGRRGRPGDTKATGDSKDRLGIIHAHNGSYRSYYIKLAGPPFWLGECGDWTEFPSNPPVSRDFFCVFIRCA